MIWFNVLQAREYLLKHKLVYTLRPKERRQGTEVLAYDNFGAKGKVDVAFETSISSEAELREFCDTSDLGKQVLKNSGFKTVDEWLSHTDREFPMYLYKVKMIL